jgi:hypothetical protein
MLTRNMLLLKLAVALFLTCVHHVDASSKITFISGMTGEMIVFPFHQAFKDLLLI